jgi:hypothetical protein
MKFLFSFLFLAFIGLTACEKADVAGIANLAGNDQQLKEMIPPNQLFLLGTYTVWLDPTLVGLDGVDSNEIYFEPAQWSGYKEVVGECEVIICEEEGNTCGRVYTITENGVTFIGLYLC